MASAEKQAARNREILIAKARGDETNEIALRHDLSPTRVRQILAEGSSRLTDTDHDPVAVAIEHRAEYAMVLEKAKTLFEAIPDSNPSPKVGALRLYLAALNDLCTWDQVIGFLPAPALPGDQQTASSSGSSWTASKRPAFRRKPSTRPPKP